MTDRIRWLLALFVLAASAPAQGAGDDVVLPAPVVETKSSARWAVARIYADRQSSPSTITVGVLGKTAAGAWLEDTATVLIVTPQGTTVGGYAVERAGVAPACAATLEQLIDLTATGYTLHLKTLLSTCLGGT